MFWEVQITMSNAPTTAAFLSPYQLGKVLSGVIPANKVKRPNWLQTFFSRVETSVYPTVNFDFEYIHKNIMGQFVEPDADTVPVQLQDFGTREMRFAYSKEGLNSPDYEELVQRRIGQQFGTVDVLGNEAWILQQKLMYAEQRFENLFEKISSDILIYGGYSAKSELHRDIKYDFGRTVVSTAAELAGDLVPAANLTASAIYKPWDSSNVYMPVVSGVTGGNGAKAWTKANVTAGTSTPVKDLVKMYETAKFRAGTEACVMSSDAYDAFNYDVETNYKDAANMLTAVILRAERDILPRIKDVQGLTLKRSWAVGPGELVDIYVYDGLYNDRITGARTKYVPDGWCVLIPSSDNGVKIYGRIQHPRAQYAPMPRWLNFWENTKTGKREWEYHTSFVMGHAEINSVVAWKVC